jgi:hypothetical protein
VLVALAALEAAVHGTLVPSREDWLALAARFGGAAPPSQALEALRVASERAARAGDDAPTGDVAAALVALAGGAAPASAAPDLAALLGRLAQGA